MHSHFLVTFALVAAASASCMHGTSLMRRQVTAEGAVKVSNFGYSGERGPLNWAGIDPANSACRTSKVQSPIVLDNTVGKATSAPKLEIASVEEAEFENLGTTLETIVSGTTTFEGKEFGLKQFHLHTPSEHRINEEYFPLEMHMVHEAADGSIAVIAVPFQLTEDGSTTELLTSVIKNIDAVATPGTITKTGALDFTELIQAVETRPLFQYSGSLTTPPCAEGLTFLVVEQPLALNVATYNKLKSVIKFNARYTQNPLGQTNLLDVAVNLAVKEEPERFASNTSSSEASCTANLPAELVELMQQGNTTKMALETLTKTQTIVHMPNGKTFPLESIIKPIGKEHGPSSSSTKVVSNKPAIASKVQSKAKPGSVENPHQVGVVKRAHSRAGKRRLAMP